MAIKALYNKILPQTCGVGELGYFRDEKEIGVVYGESLSNLKPMGGAGWAIASFTSQKAMKETYEAAEAELRARWPVVYESPKRRNTRTGRTFWFCIFDTRGKVAAPAVKKGKAK
jgi:hypothetical protein